MMHTLNEKRKDVIVQCFTSIKQKKFILKQIPKFPFAFNSKCHYVTREPLVLKRSSEFTRDERGLEKNMPGQICIHTAKQIRQTVHSGEVAINRGRFVVAKWTPSLSELWQILQRRQKMSAVHNRTRVTPDEMDWVRQLGIWTVRAP